MTHTKDTSLLCWGRKASYANGQWIKLARGDDKAAIRSRLEEGFELCFCPIGHHPESKGYCAGHPWYYKLGGAVFKPKAILEHVKASKYQGYRQDDISSADNKYEPERSALLRSIRISVISDLHSDLARYRELACQLRLYRKMDKTEKDMQPICSDIHTNISLKYNHLYNDFAHLVYIDELLSQQLDLFD